MSAEPRDGWFERASPWVAVRLCPTLRAAEQYALVLVAVGISTQMVPAAGGVALLTASGDAARARRELDAYDLENRRPSGLPAAADRPLRDGLTATLLVTAVMVFLHSASARYAFSVDWLAAGSAQAGEMLAGHWERAVTALGLHGDLGHLLSNLVFGGMIGLLLAQMIGSGLAWLGILVGGTAGNVANALLQSPGHTSIGASTAVFAGLGILAALSFDRTDPRWRRGWRRWVPLATAVALLAFLGTEGERTDIGAHVAGLVSGGIIGAGLLLAGPRIPRGLAAQLAYGAAAAVLFAGAWAIALAR